MPGPSSDTSTWANERPSCCAVPALTSTEPPPGIACNAFSNRLMSAWRIMRSSIGTGGSERADRGEALFAHQLLLGARDLCHHGVEVVRQLADLVVADLLHPHRVIAVARHLPGRVRQLQDRPRHHPLERKREGQRKEP